MQFNYLHSCSQQGCDVPNIITLFTIGWTIEGHYNGRASREWNPGLLFIWLLPFYKCCYYYVNVCICLCVELCVLVWMYNLCVSEAHRQYGISLVQGKCGNENNLKESILSFFTVFWDQTQVIRLSLIPCVLFFLNGVRKLIFHEANKEGKELNS